jgi:MoaA/NifB/PqqE/SkfB family radical SAM enzyme
MFTTIYLETTTVCNIHCSMCPRFGGEEISSMPEIMPIEVYRSVQPYFSQLEHMALVGCGEPTTDKRLLNFVREANEKGVYVMFTTNGMLLDERYSRLIIESGLKLLGVSIDGATAETFEGIRDGASYQKVLRNLARFMQIRREYGDRPIVKAQIVLMKQNIHELASIIDLAANFGVEEVYAKNLCFLRTNQLTSESMQKEYNPAVDVTVRDEYIDRALEKARERGIRFILPGFRREGRNDCPYHPETTLFIRRNGDVFPCPIYAVWNYGVARNIIREKWMGNVLENSPLEIWESERYISFRDNFASAQEELCVGCTVWRQGYQQYSPKPIQTYTY